LNLSSLIREVWKDERVRELRLRKDEVKIIVEVVADCIVNGLLQYGKLKMQGLFTIGIKKMRGKKISNPQTRESMQSNDYYKVWVKPSKRLKDGMKELE